MENNLGIITLLPILITLSIVFFKKDVFLSLLIGITIGFTIIILNTNSITYILEILISVFSNISTIKTTLFILLIGGLINVIEKSNGVEGFVFYLSEKSNLVTNKFKAQLLIQLIGLILFVDATSSIIVTSLVGKSFSKQYNIPKEKIALIANSTGSPITWIIPFSGAGAMVASILNDIEGINMDGFSYVVQSIPFQFYTIIILSIVFLSNVFNIESKNIKKLINEAKTNKDLYLDEYKDYANTSPMNMIFPIGIVLSVIFIIMFVTGDGNIMSGDGSSAVFFSGIITIFMTGIYYRINNICSNKEYRNWCIEGMKNISKIVMILILSFIFSNTLQRLGTANYLADFLVFVPKYLIAPAIFILSVIIAISTGTSSGCVAILTPIAILISQNIGIDIPLILGAIISGAVIGDQNSPISDSVILTSSVVGIDILEHVKTQMPYTSLAFIISLVLYFIVGL